MIADRKYGLQGMKAAWPSSSPASALMRLFGLAAVTAWRLCAALRSELELRRNCVRLGLAGLGKRHAETGQSGNPTTCNDIGTWAGETRPSDDRTASGMNGWRFEFVAEQSRCNRGQGETILCFAQWVTIVLLGITIVIPQCHVRSYSIKVIKIVGKALRRRRAARGIFGNGRAFLGPDKLNERR